MLLCEGVTSVRVLLQPMLHCDEASLRPGVSVTSVSLPRHNTYNPSQALLKLN